MNSEGSEADVRDTEPFRPGGDGGHVTDSADSETGPASLVALLRRLADARDTWENARYSRSHVAGAAASWEMASVIDEALAALTARLVDGAAVRLIVSEVEADTLLTHAVPSLAVLCRVHNEQGWFTPHQTILSILGGIDFAVELVQRTRTRATNPASSHILRSLELRITALHMNRPPT
ncbi:hypothetical protein ACRAKI_22000 [Saccharothrix isguenensis]